MLPKNLVQLEPGNPLWGRIPCSQQTCEKALFKTTVCFFFLVRELKPPIALPSKSRQKFLK